MYSQGERSAGRTKRCVRRTFMVSRMSAMDNATRNAGEMIKKLTTTYNRSRQAMITT